MDQHWVKASRLLDSWITVHKSRKLLEILFHKMSSSRIGFLSAEDMQFYKTSYPGIFFLSEKNWFLLEQECSLVILVHSLCLYTLYTYTSIRKKYTPWLIYNPLPHYLFLGHDSVAQTM